MENSQTYKRLGALTFWIFIFENAWLFIIPLLALCVIIIIRMFGAAEALSNLLGTTTDLIETINTAFNWGILGAVVFFILGATIAFGMALIDYFTFSFEITEHAIRIRRGIINTEEVSIPYRQIQNVDIDRPFFYQLFGASRLVILTAGHDDDIDDDYSDESEGAIPAISKAFAEELRDELLKRSNIQEVVEVGK